MSSSSFVLTVLTVALAVNVGANNWLCLKLYCSQFTDCNPQLAPPCHSDQVLGTGFCGCCLKCLDTIQVNQSCENFIGWGSKPCAHGAVCVQGICTLAVNEK